MNFNIYKNIKKQGDLVFLCLILFFGLALNKIPIIEGARGRRRSTGGGWKRKKTSKSKSKPKPKPKPKNYNKNSYRRFPTSYYIIYYNHPMYTTGHRRSWSRQRKYNDIKSKMENDPELIANKDIHGWTYDKVIGAPYDRTSLRYQYRKGTELLQGNTVGDILTDIKVKEKIEPEAGIKKQEKKKKRLPLWVSLIILTLMFLFFWPLFFVSISMGFVLAVPEFWIFLGWYYPRLFKALFYWWWAIPLKFLYSKAKNTNISKPSFSKPSFSKPSFSKPEFIEDFGFWMEDKIDDLKFEIEDRNPKVIGGMFLILLAVIAGITIPIVVINNNKK
tara:strand:- start:244 stop:1239 length:996 start_codon:yes stop_codon:yes gene_type:complete